MPSRRALNGLGAGTGAVALAVAFWSQYGLGLVPCHLCIFQRVTVAALIGMMIGTRLAPRISARTLTRAFAILLMLLAVAMVAGELRR